MINISSQTRRLGLIFVLVFLILDALLFGFLGSAFSNISSRVSNRGFYQGRTHLYSTLPGRPKQPLRIAIVTQYSADNYGQQLRKLTWSNKQKYAAAHGYDLYDAETNKYIKEKIAEAKPKMKNFFFFKFLAMQEVMNGGEATGGKQYDWVVWVDADSIYLNFGKKYEDVIDERFDLIITAGPPDNPTWSNVVNAGSYLMKNSDFSISFLEDALQLSQTHCGEYVIDYPEAGSAHNGWLQLCNADGSFWLGDQGIMMSLYLHKPQEYKCHVKKTWFRAFNSEFPWYGPGDLLVHFPGKTFEDRRKLIKAFNKYSNFKNGAVDYKYTELLDPEDSITSDLVELESHYSELNPICQ